MSKFAGFACALVLVAPTFAMAQPGAEPVAGGGTAAGADTVLVGSVTAAQATAIAVAVGTAFAISGGGGSSSTTTTSQ